ncbi:MAG TPA: FAD-dependent oxidoreductase [Dermatophilaceae bacterium]|nr:FAD-dependent oxidoreductase [Dermatophilaceae bacterium]
MDQTRRRVAVVGAGPSGLFAAQSLVKQGEVPVSVDLFDRLPTPYGLLRYGVAPDHPSIKSVATALAKVFDSDGIRFRGNVTFGQDVSREELLAAYDAVVYAVGASEDMKMGVPGEDLPGSYSARQFVEWYSGHPDARSFDLGGLRGAAAIGVGNVAVDVARILAKKPETLDVTDMPVVVLDELRRHAVEDVWMIGRRGPQHAAFTTKELRELLEVPGVAVDINAECLVGIEESGLDRRAKANLEVLRGLAHRHVEDPHCRLHLRFWRRPVALVGTTAVTGLTLESTYLDEGGSVRGTGRSETIPVQLVLRSIGYRGTPLVDLPFDTKRAVIPNDQGRVCDADGTTLPREYVVGWAKRGPTGVIGTNKSDAAQTVDKLVEDLVQRPAAGDVTRLDLDAALAARGRRASSFEDWLRIDAEETRRGGALGRQRTKVSDWAELRALCGMG